MKILLLVVSISVAAWWYFIEGRKMTEAHVTEYYHRLELVLERKPDELCSLLSDDFKSSGTAGMQGMKVLGENDKARTCEAYQELYTTWAKLAEKMGGTLQFDSEYKIQSISISADQRSATVDVSSSLDVGGSNTNIRSLSTDTLVRKNGKVMMIRSEGRGSVNTGS